MVHYVHHYSQVHVGFCRKWCTECTISATLWADLPHNGAPDAPIRRVSRMFPSKMVHEVHQSAGSPRRFPAKRCTRCTNRSGPRTFSRKTVYKMHHFFRFLALLRSDWCSVCANPSLLSGYPHQNGVPRAPASGFRRTYSDQWYTTPFVHGSCMKAYL